MSVPTCPACGADPGTVGVIGGHLCPTCMHREGVLKTSIEERLAALESRSVDCESARRDGAASTLEAVARELDKAGWLMEIDARKMATSLRRWATRIRTGEEKLS